MTGGDQSEAFLSDLYHALRATRRRQAVQLVREAAGEPISTRELARQITAMEQGVSTTNATGEAYRNAYNALSQTHLPTLSEAGIIIYDSDRQTVRSGRYLAIAALLIASNNPAITVLLDLIETEEIGTEEPAMTD